MSRRKIVLATIFMGLAVSPVLSEQGSSLSHFATKEDDNRREMLYLLYKMDKLTSVEYVGHGQNIGLAIDSDIEIIDAHSELLVEKRNSAKGYIYDSKAPGFYKGMGIACAVTSVVSGLLSGAIIGDGMKNYFRCYSCKPGSAVLILGDSLVAAAVSVASGVSAKLCFNVATKRFVQNIQDQIDLDLLVIIRLKEIKYQLTGNALVSSIVSEGQSNTPVLAIKKEDGRREMLYCLYKMGKLTDSEYDEYGQNADSVVGHDIAIIKAHFDLLMTKKDSAARGYFYNSKASGFYKTVGIASTVTSFLTGCLSVNIIAGVINRGDCRHNGRAEREMGMLVDSVINAAVSVASAVCAVACFSGAAKQFIQNIQNQIDLDVMVIAQLKEIQCQLKAAVNN